MSATRRVRLLIAPLFILSLALSATVLSPGALVSAPPAEVQGQSFSVASGDPLTASGVHPADILGAGGLPLIACDNLGLLCVDATTGAEDDVSALSFGWDFASTELPPLQFSVAEGSQGMAGTAVKVEASCSPAQPQADAFENALDGSNSQDLDGDGTACGTNAGFALGLTEGATSDSVDALGRDPCLFVDLNCDGLPENPIFLSLAPGSPTLGMIGATAADVLMTGVEYAPILWAGGTAHLGLATGDVIDAICVKENGNGLYDAGDLVLFSLAPGSPTLTSLPASPAALLRPGPLRIAFGEGALGLMATDDVDAFVCSTDYPPEVSFTQASQSGPESTGTMNVTAKLDRVSSLDVTVQYDVSGTATEGSDYTITPSPVTIPAGSLTTDIVITVADDGVDESDETVVVAMGTVLHAATGVTRTHTATVLDNDPPTVYLPLVTRSH
jgi:hypothetical protein